MGLDFKKDLTKSQYAATTHGDGPAMVVAGPGSGKTRVITYRIAYLLKHRNVNPHEIVAITFTNKAAAEMRKRVGKMVKPSVAKYAWISTFHSMCARMLKTNHKEFKVPWDYAIADADDSKAYLLEAVAHVLKIPKKKVKSQVDLDVVQSLVSGYKNAMVRASDLNSEEEHDPFRKEVVLIYKRYERLLENSLDFDDLLLRVAFGLRGSRKLRKGYSDAFRHILIDEYHDTNIAQYDIARNLSRTTQNVFVVFDGDQSIYSWRGADPRNISNFQRDYSDYKLYKLQRNFRSVKPIADVANKVIVNNADRIDKTIITVRPGGSKTECWEFNDPQQEAGYIAEQIRDKVKMGKATYKDFTILYRVNSRSRAFEEVFRRTNIPYKVIGALGFYQRKVVKDILAYLRLLNNINDFASFSRAHNEPSRGIGDKSYEAILDVAQQHGVSPLEVIRRGRYKGQVKGRALDGVRTIKKLFKKLRKMPKKPVAPLVRTIIEDSGYRRKLELALRKAEMGSGTAKKRNKKVQQAQDRLELLDEFEDAVVNYDQTEGRILQRYMEFVSLMQSTDERAEDANRVGVPSRVLRRVQRRDHTPREV
jgi:DNA helicase-2/ATP-dependent DNA helicase PcrA